MEESPTKEQRNPKNPALHQLYSILSYKESGSQPNCRKPGFFPSELVQSLKTEEEFNAFGEAICDTLKSLDRRCFIRNGVTILNNNNILSYNYICSQAGRSNNPGNDESLKCGCNFTIYSDGSVIFTNSHDKHCQEEEDSKKYWQFKIDKTREEEIINQIVEQIKNKSLVLEDVLGVIRLKIQDIAKTNPPESYVKSLYARLEEIYQENKRFNLDSNEKLLEWSEFVAKAFNGKRPKEYFRDKAINDDTFDFESDVKILKHNDSFIISTLRLFRDRKIYGCEEKIIGIGEVCVHAGYRRKGLGEILLRLVLSNPNLVVNKTEDECRQLCSEATSNFACPFSLHASDPNARKLYKKCGFISCSPIQFVRLEYPKDQRPTGTKDEQRFRLIDLENDVEHVSTLYNQMKIQGTEERTKVSYWTKWISSKWKMRGGKGFLSSDFSVYGYFFPVDDNTLRFDEFGSRYGRTLENEESFLQLIDFALDEFGYDSFIVPQKMLNDNVSNFKHFLKEVQNAYCDDGWMTTMDIGLGSQGYFYDSDAI